MSTSNSEVFHRLVREAMAVDGLSRSAAERAAAARYPQFAPAPAPSGPVAGQTAEAELERRARQYQRDHPGTSYAQAYVNVLNADAALYVRFLKEHEAALAARHV